MPTGVERRPRSHRMKFCVQKGLGALPSTSKRRGKSRRDFLLCGPVCINTGIACRYYPWIGIILEQPPFSLFRMMEAAGVIEELKARDPMRWVGLMNTLKAQAEEIVLTELIYQ